jgi:pimeloyl-ACP methyl ester carboxylesterase
MISYAHPMGFFCLLFSLQVLLLHGFPNFWYVWKNQFQPLAEAGFHVIAPDMRGYNTSSKPIGVASYGRQPVLSDVVCIIDHFGAGKRAIVVGHDWGGAVAWALAEDYPSKLTKIVVVNSAHLSVLGQLMWTNFQQLWRTWYILFFQLSWLPEFVMSCRRYYNFNGFTPFEPE